MKKIFLGILIGIMLFCMGACGKTENAGKAQTTTEYAAQEETAFINSTEDTVAEVRTAEDIIKEIIIFYGYYREKADERIEDLFAELDTLDTGKSKQWRDILDYWKYANNEMPVNYYVIPDGLPENDGLCIVVLGYALNPDGTMKSELEGRLTVALESAEKYPNAYIVCTGGGTAAKNKNVTEAGQMAAWLLDNGIDSDRIIIEDDSLTTGQNAVFTYKILKDKYPQITSIAIVSSDYHIPWGSVLFHTVCFLGDEDSDVQSVGIVANAAYIANNNENYPFAYQAAGLLEIIGDTETANKIYTGTFEKPELW